MMVTGYHLEPGYAYSEKNRATPKMIQAIAKSIPLSDLREKCLAYGLRKNFGCAEGCTLDMFLGQYSEIPTRDATCKFTESGVMQLASSGLGHRMEREVIRKAFSILVLEECFKQGLSISLLIT